MTRSFSAVQEQIRNQDPPIIVGSIWVVKDRNGKPLRRLRILAPHPDGGWIYDELPSQMRSRDLEMGHTPEFNLRYVFEPEEER